MTRLCLIALILLYTPITALGDGHDDLVHATAHLGLSYALTDVFYGVFRRGFEMPKTTAYLFSITYTLVLGLTYEYVGMASMDHTKKAMIWNGVGAGLRGLTIKAFDF
jgi:hypothetical protein